MRIGNLVDEIVLSIFGRLSLVERIKLERVCSSWRRLSRATWRNVRALDFCQSFDNDHEFLDIRDSNRVLIAMLQRAGPALLGLTLADSFCSGLFVDVTPKSLRAVGIHCPNLVSLDLSYMPLSTEQTAALRHLPASVELLSLVRCFDDEVDPDASLGAVFAQLPHLRVLDLSMNDSLRGTAFGALGDSLEEMLINRCFAVLPEHVETLALRCPQLQRFEFSGCSGDLAAPLAQFAFLRQLNLSYYEGGVLDSVFGRSLTMLVSLQLGHSSSVTTDLVEALSLNCPRMAKLNLSGKSGARAGVNLNSLARLCSLTDLDISWLEHLTDHDLYALSTPGNLQVVHAYLCDRLTDAGVLDLIQRSPNLNYLDLTGCSGISAAFPKVASALCTTRTARLEVHIGSTLTNLTTTTACDHNHKLFAVVTL